MQSGQFGAKGDFITAPEMSSIFGEVAFVYWHSHLMASQLLGAWVLGNYHAAGKPKKIQLVELGPGQGTLMTDVLRVIRLYLPKPNDFSSNRRSKVVLRRFVSRWLKLACS